jgi:DNA-binding MarR family transcriptional regulator
LSITQARQFCHCGAIRDASRRVLAFYDAIMKPSGLTMPQYRLLGLIEELGEVSVNALAARSGLDRTTASRTLRPLEKAGFVRIEQSTLDGRQRDITLTRAGRKALAQGRTLWRKAQQRFEDANGEIFSQSLRASLHGLKLDMPERSKETRP